MKVWRENEIQINYKMIFVIISYTKYLTKGRKKKRGVHFKYVG